MDFNRLVLLCITIPCICDSRIAFTQAAKSEPSDARRKITAYDQELKSIKDDREKIQLTRTFLDALKDSESKIEGIEYIGNRYVYVLPTGIEGELIAPFLEDADASVRAEAARTIGYLGVIGRTKVVNNSKRLLALVNDPDWQVRSGVLYAMGHSGEDEFFAPLKASLNDPNANVRHDASFELGVWLGNSTA